MRVFRKMYSIIWLCLIALFCWLMLDLTIPYLGFRTDVDFLLTKQKIIHLSHWRWAFYVHILFSIFALMAGLTQFSEHIQKKYRQLHRSMGYIYVTDILCLAGPSGFVLALYANGNDLARASFIMLSLLWIFTTGLAVYKALKKQWEEHRHWMIRSYALTLSAISLRLMALVLPHFLHLDARTEYALIAWLSWTLNLVIAETIIYYTKNKA